MFPSWIPTRSWHCIRMHRLPVVSSQIPVQARGSCRMDRNPTRGKRKDKRERNKLSINWKSEWKSENKNHWTLGSHSKVYVKESKSNLALTSHFTYIHVCDRPRVPFCHYPDLAGRVPDRNPFFLFFLPFCRYVVYRTNLYFGSIGD